MPVDAFAAPAAQAAEGAWPLAAALGAGVAALLGVVIADLHRAVTSSPPPARHRRPPLLWAALGALVGALALAVWCVLADARLLAVRHELPIASVVFAAAIVGLAATGWALRILALPRDSRREGDGVSLAIAATFALGVGGCYGVMIVPPLLADLFH